MFFFCLNCCLLYACNCWSSSCFFKAVSAVSVRTTVNMFILNLNQRVGDSWCHLLLPSHLWKIILACCCLCPTPEVMMHWWWHFQRQCETKKKVSYWKVELHYSIHFLNTQHIVSQEQALNYISASQLCTAAVSGRFVFVLSAFYGRNKSISLRIITPVDLFFI